MRRRVRLQGRWLLVSGLSIVLSPISGLAQERPDADQAATRFEMPDTSRFRMFLQNRLVAFVVPDGSAPLVSFSAMVRAGTSDDSDPGAAEMMALMLATRGPCWMVPGSFRETLTDMAAEFRVHMTPELTQVTLNVAADNALDGLRVFSGIVRETCVDEQGLAAFRDQIADQQQKASAADSATVRFEGNMTTAVNLFNQVLYGDHPYASNVSQTEAEALTLADVERFHDDFFVPANITLAVSGDFDVGQMAQAVDQRFADWEDRRPPFLKGAPDVSGARTHRTHYFRSEGDRAWIVIGHDLPEVEPRDLPALQLMNYILAGGRFSARLSRETQTGGGRTSDAGGYVEPNLRGPGTYTFRTSARPDEVVNLVDTMLNEIERMRTDTVTAAELRNAQAVFVDRVIPMRFEHGHAAAMTFATEWTKYATFQHLARYRDRIQDVSVRDVQRAAERYLKPARMQIVILGPNRPS